MVSTFYCCFCLRIGALKLTINHNTRDFLFFFIEKHEIRQTILNFKILESLNIEK
jgi:hypothetical protein